MATQDKNSERVEKREPQQSALSRTGGYDPFGFFWNPFSLMRRMTEEMDRAFGQFGFGRGESGWMPAVDVSERDGKYLVHAELPGLKPEDVKVCIEEGNLVLEGERKSEHQEEKGGFHRSATRHGGFSPTIALP